MNRLFSLILSAATLAALPIQAGLLVPASSPNWRFKNGLTEASSPTTAWRGSNFNDAAFATLPASFYYGDAQPSGTLLTDMMNGYTCFFLRHAFVVTNVAEVTGLQLRSLIDDGYVMWINGVEVHRFGVTDPLLISTFAANQVEDPAQFHDYTIANAPASVLVNGTNFLCVQVFNTTLASSDIGFDCQLTSLAPDFIPPAVASQIPAPGVVSSLTSVTVNFGEPVTGVDAGDLLINGSAALAVSGAGATYTFTIAELPEGAVSVTWAEANNILDYGIPANPFDGTAPGNTWQYSLVDNIPPVLSSIAPLTNSIVRLLNRIEVIFSEPVSGVDAGDLLINNVPAANLSQGVPGQYVFTFPQPATGAVQVVWASGHDIKDLATVPNSFGGGGWTYLLDPNVAFFDIRINEFMAENDTGIRDEDGDYSDWIELYNASSTAVDLTGWYLTDNAGKLTNWLFPAVAMPANSYLLVWASGKNRTTNIAALHSNFQLGKNGEYLGLVLPDGTNVISSFSPFYPEQQTDASYGRDRLDPSIVGFYATPTPRAPNSTGGPGGFAPEVKFSRASGTFLSPFSLKLTTASTNAVIRYVVITNLAMAAGNTVLTNIPTTNSPIYTNPIPISMTTQIRARAFQTGLFPSAPVTETYIQIDATVAKFSSDLPICVVHALGAASITLSGGDQAGVFMIFGTNSGRSSLANAPALTTRMGVNDRGASTGGQAKQNLAVEFWDEFNQDIKYPFLDMPQESDWVLYGINGFDPGLMHNAIFHWFGDQIGQPASRTRYVEVYRKVGGGPITTNDYFGLYLVEEKTKQGKGRLDIADLNLENTNAPSVTGGYLMKIDRNDADERTFSPPVVPLQAPQVGSIRSTPALIEFVYPNVTPTTSDPRRLIQINYIQNYIMTFVTNLASVGYTNPVTGYAQYIDPDQWVDNLIANIICFNVDGYRLSGFFHKDRNGRLMQGPLWDCDRCMGTGGTATPQADNRCFNPRMWRGPASDVGTDNGTDFFGVSNVGVSWFARLFRDPDFWQRFIDRYQAYRTNEYSTNAIFAMLDGFHAEIKEAQVREQARWAPSGFTYPRAGVQNVSFAGTTYSFDFGPADNAGRGRFINEVNFQKKWFVDRLEFMDTNFLAMPRLSAGTRLVPSGSLVTVTPAIKANTLLLYTLDGSDPRLPGGGVSPSAKTNIGTLSLTITNSVLLTARCYNTSHANMTNSGTEVGKPLINSFWSGPAKATYYLTVPALRITEVMYHPPKPPFPNTNDADNFEFVELKNSGGAALNLAGFRLSGGINFTFTNVVLNAGQYCVVVKSTAAFQSRYGAGVLIAGEYTGNLANDGDHVVLSGPLGEPIHDFNYGGSWYALADGGGFSLALADENLASTNNYSTNTSWRISAFDQGSPGQVDPAPSLPPLVVVNEAITHTDPVVVGDTIELRNPGATNAPIGYWYLTDEFDTPRKYQVPSDIVIPAGGQVVFNELATFGLGSNGFGLSSRGENIYVFSGDAAGRLTGWYHGFGFGAQFTDVSFGRYLDSTNGEHFVSQKTNTLGAANAGPKVGPVVVNEIMYHPPDINQAFVEPDNTADEYIELRNISAQPVPLYHATFATNTWRLRNAVDYQFPLNVVLPVGGFAVVVSFDPADAEALDAFRAKYTISNGTPIFGPYSGKLDNSSDGVELAAPDAPILPPAADAGFVPYVLIDKVEYHDTLPWNAAADGFGPSLQRIVPGDYGNQPTNWVAARPNPGVASVIGSLPVVLEHPASQIVVGASSATFRVVAGGLGPFSYQWRFNTNAIYGATGSSYTVTNAQLASQGVYDCLVLNDAGAVFSSNAVLTVRLPANLLLEPTNILVFIRPDPKAAPTTNVTFFVRASSTNPPITYQWRKGDANIPGATTTNLTINNVGFAEEGFYSCAVSDGIGTILTSNALLQPLITPKWQVYPVFVTTTNGTNVITTSNNVPLLLTVVTGAVVRMSVQLAVGYPFPITYEWRRGSVGIGPDSTNVASRLYDYYTFQAPLTVSASTLYRVIAKNLYIYTTTPPSAGVNYDFRITTVADSDGDGLPDPWGTNFFNTTNTAALLDVDSDGDGMSNWKEYIAGTDPTNALSVLRISPLTPAGGAWVEFTAMSNHTYTVEYTDDLGAVPWSKLGDSYFYPTNRVERFSDPAGGTNRFYRVVVPQRP